MATLRRGAVAGGVATVAMSAVMWLAQKAGLMGEQPPKKITHAALAAVDATPVPEPAENALSLGVHMGFGMACGMAFAVGRRAVRLPLPRVLQGVAFASGVWAVSYQGWVPALGIMPPPEHDRRGRPASMIAAHVVFGAVLGTLAN